MKPAVRPIPRLWLAGLALAALAACSSSPDKPRPANLPPAATVLGTQQVWTAQVGASQTPVAPRATADHVFVAGAGNSVVALAAESGKEVWRLALGAPVTTGIGTDGDTVAVVTQDNDLVAMAAGQQLWRVRLGASAQTAPLVAGRRVFVLAADRSVVSFDGQTGKRLWTQTRTGEPLVLNQPGALLAVGDTLVAGLGGRLVGLNPLNGSVRWEASIANARGTNEVERLVDIVGPVSRVGNSVCARAYASAVGCVDAGSGRVTWSKSALGSQGLGGDDRLVFGSESDGRVQAWQRSNGEDAWSVDRLKHRGLTAPVALGRVIAVGDGTGLVHLLSREDGAEMARLSSDGSAIVGAPLLVGPSLVVQTRNGGVFAWRPQ
ncbi:outer membrane protein assembly factor BamB [Hydrogenophaga sp.]|uniref:outer membrane protein assembly factor BamB n=1 Tax=Hydrogenophaga sp. TaxID=1904254 RepID=UPI00286D8000|nr:outer membrane protein assembly factor BamB [Hydrogenophaga sp.]